jgi:Holliday junction resolvasome RuvABC endonuclease subunit
MHTDPNANIEEDAKALRKAMKGIGTDENAIIKIVANRTYPQRKAIYDSFYKQFDRNLISDLKSELGGKLEDVVIGLFTEPVEYDVIQLKKAMKGAGTDEDTLMEIFASRPNWYIKKIKEIYRIKYDKDLIDDVQSELSGDLKQCMVSIINLVRSENQNPDENYCKEKSEELYKAGEKRLGTDEETFIKILTECSPSEICLINKIYTENYGHDLIKAIDNEFSRKMKIYLKSIVHAIINCPEYFATRVNKAIKGWGTNDKMLIRVLVSRCDVDLLNIMEAYQKLYGKSMYDDIKNDTSGDYRKILLELCN